MIFSSVCIYRCLVDRQAEPTRVAIRVPSQPNEAECVEYEPSPRSGVMLARTALSTDPPHRALNFQQHWINSNIDDAVGGVGGSVGSFGAGGAGGGLGVAALVEPEDGGFGYEYEDEDENEDEDKEM